MKTPDLPEKAPWLKVGPLAVRIAAICLLASACTKQETAPEPVRAVKTVTITAEGASGTIDYAAEIRARVESRLAFRVGGKMISREVGLGDTVKKGQVLARLDPQDLRLGQDAARSAVESARVTQDQAAADFKRFKELRDQGFISSADLERREATLKSTIAQLEQARAQEGMQSNQARYSTLVADVAGVVTAIEAEPGAVLSAGATVLRVAQEGARDAVFSVPEDQIAGIRASKGRAGLVQVRIWGEASTAMPAVVREVAAAADPATRTFAVKADLGQRSVALGQTATVSIATPAVPGAIKLPLSAIFEQQGKSSVWLLDKGTMTVRIQPVQVAGAEGNQVVVAAGVSPGQQVVVAGVHLLTPGQKVSQYEMSPSVAGAGAVDRHAPR